ncbi:glutamate--tRNA ligase [candidate division KSB1 bacterium]|nr:glutamate--tRNA ligase [candidate division KSB1 bacterium]
MSEVRTRFAPSPTGYLHVGGLRSALYNYLFAKQQGGVVLLRIEDTDQSREVKGAVENLLAAFHWLGLEFDEGPHVGGACGPYVQSQRLTLYREHVKRLADANHAYPCFCAPATLDEMRAAQGARGEPPMYDRRCKSISPADARRRIERGEAHVWRMAVPGGQIVRVHDLVRGDVEFATDTVDDQVLLKSDGFPTYHLANVVDDHYMRISHVIRGEEWLPSAPKHALLYACFGWERPRFAHLPLLLNPDRSKMSKRGGDVAVEDYRRNGILPAALINFVALLGWHPQDEREIFSVDELVKEFSLERVNKAGAIFDGAKLRWMNAEYIKRESEHDLYAHVAALLTEQIEICGESRVRYAVATLRGGTEVYGDLADRIRATLGPRSADDPESIALLANAEARKLVTEFQRRMSEIPPEIWNDFPALEAAFKAAANDSGQAVGLKGKSLWQTVRAALTGQLHGPELAKLVGIWGRARVMAELENAASATTAVSS